MFVKAVIRAGQLIVVAKIAALFAVPFLGLIYAASAGVLAVGLASALVVWLYEKYCFSDDDPVSPLILDLDGDGVESESATFFDHAGDGFAELSPWVSEDDGVLAIDLDGNGTIDNGTELFGNFTLVGTKKAKNGFVALAPFDSNSDGIIDSTDDDWDKLRVYRWTDSNNNNFFDEGEGSLETLAQNGIASLSLEYVSSSVVDSSGNEHRQVGSYTKSDGTTNDLVDVWFQTMPRLTKPVRTSIPEHSVAVAGLPDAIGSGLVYDLRDAMALDDAGLLNPPLYGAGRQEQRTLAQLVAAFDLATNNSVRDDLLEKILLRWAGAEAVGVGDYWDGTYFAYSTPRKLAVVEAFTGSKWREGDAYRHPALSTSQKINLIYLGISENLRAQLLKQTLLKDMFEAISFMHDGEEVTSETDLSDVDSDDLTLDFSGILELENAAVRIGDFLRSLAALTASSPALLSALESASVGWAYEYQYHSDYLAGMVSDGITQHANEFIGDDNSNTFRSIDGGSDSLRGAGGADIYQLGRGTGHDVIYEDYNGNNDGLPATDVVKVAPGIDSSQVILGRDGLDLVIRLVNSEGQVTDSLRVKYHYSNDDARIEAVELGDGGRYSPEDLADVALAKGDGTQGPDRYDALLVSGALRETQRGGRGSDIYFLGRSTGHEVIDEAYRNQTGSEGDVIRLKEGLALANVKLSREGADLKVGLVGANGVITDSLTVKGHYLGGGWKVEFLESSDGTRLLDLLAAESGVKLQNGNSGGILEGLGGGIADTFGIDAGSDTFRGKSGNDVYELGLGSGTDYVEEGCQNRLAGDGADTVRLGAGVTSSMARMRKTMWDLVVELVDSAGEVTDSLTVRDQYRHGWAKVERVVLNDGSSLWTSTDIDALPFTGPTYRQSSNAIRGSGINEDLAGSDAVNDIFDSDAGGNDRLFGRRGDDEYRLGSNTGLDEVHEGAYKHGYMIWHTSGDAGDLIKVESGHGTGDVRLRRDDRHLWVELLGTAGDDGVRPVTDSLKMVDYYHREEAKVETVEFADGTVWGSHEFHAVALRGGTGNDDISGRDDLADIFDSDAGGNDRLFGRLGDDEYRLGTGTGLDEVHEGSYKHGYMIWHTSGDAGDLIRIEAGHGTGDVRLRRDDRHLWVELLGTAGDDGVRPVTDSLKVVDYYHREEAKVETVEFADGTVWGLDEFHAVALRGGTGNDDISGRDDLADIFDSDMGGNDRLFGRLGDDEYRLGTGTGLDEVHEGSYKHGHNVWGLGGDANDLIKVESGHGAGDVRLRRDDRHLWVELLGPAGDDGERSVTDSLKVVDYYHKEAKVETVEFSDGTVWGSAEFHAVALRGGAGNDDISGRDDLADIFDSDAGGNDRLFGRRGDDEYRLGSGTGLDEVREGSYKHGHNVWGLGGDAGDLIRIEVGHGTVDIRLRRDDRHLWVELLGTAGDDGVRPVTDSLKVVDYYHREEAKVETVEFSDGTVWGSDEFHAVALRGGTGNDDISGRDDLADIFDSDAGGNDRLFGRLGDDEYRLGSGTGLDEVHEGSYKHGHNVWGLGGDDGDLIRIEAGYGTGDVRLRRDDRHLWVELLGTAGENGERSVTDSLKVVDYFHRAVAKVETVEFSDGTVWGSGEFHAVALRGGTGNDDISGRDDLADIFDSDAGGNDRLFGRLGDDEYRLGTGTGLDEVHEGSYKHGHNVWGLGGDDGDLIRIEAGHGTGDVRLRRDDRHLWVELLGTAVDGGERSVTDSLKVVDYFHREEAKVETVEFSDGTVWGSDEFHAVALRGGTGNDDISGRDDLADIFDSDAGGNDRLFGRRGDDEYRLGSGTGLDEVHEGAYRHGHSIWGLDGDDGDLIKVEADHGFGDTRLSRDGNHLLVELLGSSGDGGIRSVTDSLKVVNYYGREAAKVETVEFADGTVWDGDFVVGTNQGDTITSTTESETLHGGEGDDTYVVSGAFGDDRVVDSGGTDKVQVSGHTSGTLSFARQGDDMVMEAVGSDDRVTFDNWYAEGGSRKVERIEAGDKVLLSTAAERMATAMATFVSGGGTASDFVSRNHQDYWEALSGTPGS